VFENTNKNQYINVETTKTNTTPLLNRSAVKKLAIQISEAQRAGKFKRVSMEFLERINISLEATIREEVRRHPSIGKTLK